MSLSERISQLLFFNKFYKKENKRLNDLVEHYGDKYWDLLFDHTKLKIENERLKGDN